MTLSEWLENFTHRFAKWAGSTAGFIAAFGTILVWLVAGLIWGFPRGWEAALTAYIGIVTFLMVFLIQRSQNKELMALQVKLNELINVTQRADNHLINVEELTEKEISEVKEVHREIVEGETAANNL